MKRKKLSKKKIAIRLSSAEVSFLVRIVRSGTTKARTITRAHILLLSHKKNTDREITSALGCSHDMVSQVRTRYRDRGGAKAAIVDLPRPGQPKKVTQKHEAFVIATACTEAPRGHDHWTVPELRKALLTTYKKLRSISDERIRLILLASELKPWREKNVVHTEPHPALP